LFRGKLSLPHTGLLLHLFSSFIPSFRGLSSWTDYLFRRKLSLPIPGCYYVCSSASSHLVGVCRLGQITCSGRSIRSPILGCYSVYSPASSHLSGVCRLGQNTCSGRSIRSPILGCYSVYSPASSHLSGVCRLGQNTFSWWASSPHPYLVATPPILQLVLIRYLRLFVAVSLGHLATGQLTPHRTKRAVKTTCRGS
jgi:hypothetical protein